MKECPFCAEEIKLTAIKCKHCGSMLNEFSSRDAMQSVATDKARINLPRAWFRVLIGIAIAAYLGKLSFGFYETENYWGILTGILTLMSLGFAFYRDFDCSYCDKNDPVFIFSENKECTKCKTLHIIDWY